MILSLVPRTLEKNSLVPKAKRNPGPIFNQQRTIISHHLFLPFWLLPLTLCHLRQQTSIAGNKRHAQTPGGVAQFITPHSLPLRENHHHTGLLASLHLGRLALQQAMGQQQQQQPAAQHLTPVIVDPARVMSTPTAAPPALMHRNSYSLDDVSSTCLGTQVWRQLTPEDFVIGYARGMGRVRCSTCLSKITQGELQVRE